MQEHLRSLSSPPAILKIETNSCGTNMVFLEAVKCLSFHTQILDCFLLSMNTLCALMNLNMQSKIRGLEPTFYHLKKKTLHGINVAKMYHDRNKIIIILLLFFSRSPWKVYLLYCCGDC